MNSAEIDAKLLEAAESIRSNAYARFSKFKVGAAVLSGSGQIYTGCNVENSSYRLTVCAEQNAIAHGVANEGDSFSIEAISVTAGANVPCTPCGACRQTIFEFGPNALVRYLHCWRQKERSFCIRATARKSWVSDLMTLEGGWPGVKWLTLICISHSRPKGGLEWGTRVFDSV